MNYYYQYVATQVDFYFTACLYPFGIVLNLFALCIYSRPRLNVTNMGLLYGVKSAVDIVLLMTMFAINGKSLYGVDVVHLSEFCCKFFTWIRRWVIEVNALTYVLITLDRFMFIHFPGKYYSVKKKSTMLVLFLTTCIFIALANLPNIWFTLQSQTNSTTNTTTYCHASPQVSIASDIISIILRVYFPMLIMLTLNIIMIAGMYEQKHRVNNAAHNAGHHHKERQFTFTVFFLNFAYFVFCAPVSVAYIMYDINYYWFGDVSSDYMSKLAMILEITHNIGYSYSVFSFFFTFSLNRLFHKEVLIVFGIKEISSRI